MALPIILGGLAVGGMIKNMMDADRNNEYAKEKNAKAFNKIGASVRELKKLNDSFAVQAKQLDSTKSDMEVMSSNVSNVSATSGNISGRVATLTDAKNALTEIVSDLSAISEENAASTEQTNASMEELNATFTIISDSASKLQRLAKELEDNISFFKL